AIGLALQGDAASAATLLAKVPATAVSSDDAAFRDCMINRFGPADRRKAYPNINDPWVAALARNYVDYWQGALTRPDEREPAERELRSRMGELLGPRIFSDSDFDAAESKIKAEALKRGFHVLLGRTQPLRELMLWQKLTVEQRQIS